MVPEFLPDEHVKALRDRMEVVYEPDLYADRARLLALVVEARALLIRNRTLVDSEFLTAARSLQVVGRLGVGLDNIDVAAAARHGVTVIPAVGGNAVSVAEYVMGAMLVLQRGIYGMTESMVAGEWPRQGHAFGHELQGKVLGLLGLGAIAREVATRATAFGMIVTAHDPFLDPLDPAWTLARRVERDELLAGADVVSVHVPRNPDTIGLIGVDALARLRPGAIVINTSRGGVVDEVALAASLRSGTLAGAALDVFAAEPLGPERASIFAGLDNLILTPHIAGNTLESVDRVAAMTVGSVLAHLGL